MNTSVRAKNPYNNFVTDNLGLVRYVAHKMKHCCNIPFEDLIQIGSEGLVKAAQKFDSSKNNKFSSYAIPYIQGAILQYIRDKSRLVRPPRLLIETYQKIKRYSEKNSLTHKQAAAALGIDESLLQEAEIICNQVSLELPESLRDNSCGNANSNLDLIIELLGKLPEFHAVVIAALWIDNVPIKTFCKEHNTTVSKIRSIEQHALQQLKNIASGKTKCPNCGSYHTVKNGFRDNKQGYLCKDCKVQFRDNPKPRGRQSYPDEIKLKAITAIASGKSTYWCETYLGIDHTTAFSWYRSYIIKDNKLLKKPMLPAQSQWQITSKFTNLVEYLLKVCPQDSPELEDGLRLLNQSLQKFQSAVETKK